MPDPAEKLTVELVGTQCFATRADQPRMKFCAAPTPEDDAPPGPVEGFIASLGGCMGMFALKYCRTAGIDPTGLRFDLEWTLAENPHRIGDIRVTMQLPAHFPAPRQRALLRAVEQCTLHNTLMHPPTVSVAIAAPASVPAP
jgi:uncharacterized OsmC-like protein